MAELVSQEIQVEETFANAVETIRWQARKGEVLPLLFSPAVLTHVDYPGDAMKLEQIVSGSAFDQTKTNLTLIHRLIARKDGVYELNLHYQTRVVQRNGLPGFYLPIQPGLVNRTHADTNPRSWLDSCGRVDKTLCSQVQDHS